MKSPTCHKNVLDVEKTGRFRDIIMEDDVDDDDMMMIAVL